MKNASRQQGFTLIEIMIGLMVSAVLLLGLTRLYSISLDSYSLQNQLTEMTQNAKFATKQISDILMQAGADCIVVNGDSLQSDSNIIKTSSSPCSSFTIKVNPRGGLYMITNQTVLNTSSACSLQVDNSYAFRYADSLTKVPNSDNSPTHAVKTYKLVGVNLANNKICISGGSANDTFFINDGVYSFKSHTYFKKGTILCVDQDTLAENIDTLRVRFQDSLGTATTSWKKMKSVSIAVTSMTSQPDNRYNCPGYSDHRRRLTLYYQFRFKNKV